MVSCRSSLTVDIADNNNSPTYDPVPSPSSPRSPEQQLEPTADREPEPIETDLRIATELEPMMSDQMRELATELAKGENEKGSSAHRNIVEVDPETCPGLSACLDFPPTLPLLPHPFIPASATPPLSPASALQPSGSILAPLSPPSPVGPPAQPRFLVPPAPPWSIVVPPSPLDSTPLAAPRRSISLAPLGYSLQLQLSPLPRTTGSPPRSPEPWTPPWPSGSSVLPGLIGSPSPLRAPPPLAPQCRAFREGGELLV
ncbi:hypothetical protein M9458_006920, partial [Cirrhinus mrigala]